MYHFTFHQKLMRVQVYHMPTNTCFCMSSWLHPSYLLWSGILWFWNVFPNDSCCWASIHVLLAIHLSSLAKCHFTSQTLFYIRDNSKEKKISASPSLRIVGKLRQWKYVAISNGVIWYEAVWNIAMAMGIPDWGWVSYFK